MGRRGLDAVDVAEGGEEGVGDAQEDAAQTEHAHRRRPDLDPARDEADRTGGPDPRTTAQISPEQGGHARPQDGPHVEGRRDELLGSRVDRPSSSSFSGKMCIVVPEYSEETGHRLEPGYCCSVEAVLAAP